MTVSIDDLDRRVTALEARVRATETDQSVVNEKLLGILGSQDVVLGILRDQGRLLATHGGRLDRIEGKLDLVVDWIQNQP